MNSWSQSDNSILCGSLGRRDQKTVLWSPLPEFNLEKHPFLYRLSGDSNNSINFHEFVNQPAGQRNFLKLWYTFLSEPRYFTAMELKDPWPIPLNNDEKSGGHMDIPPPGVVRSPGPHVDQTLDQAANNRGPRTIWRDNNVAHCYICAVSNKIIDFREDYHN